MFTAAQRGARLLRLFQKAVKDAFEKELGEVTPYYERPPLLPERKEARHEIAVVHDYYGGSYHVIIDVELGRAYIVTVSHMGDHTPRIVAEWEHTMDTPHGKYLAYLSGHMLAEFQQQASD